MWCHYICSNGLRLALLDRVIISVQKKIPLLDPFRSEAELDFLVSQVTWFSRFVGVRRGHHWREMVQGEKVSTACEMRKRHHYTHYNDVKMSAIVSQITGVSIVYSTVYSSAGQRKHECSASLAFARGIHRSPHKGPVTRKKVSICWHHHVSVYWDNGAHFCEMC